MNFQEMLQGMALSARQVAILYIIVAVGVVADRVGLFTEKTALKCTDLLFYIVVPAKIIESFITLEFSPEIARKLLMAAGCAFLLHAVSITLSTVFFRRCPESTAGIYKFATTYGNCGYMSLPLVSALAGTEGVLYCSVVIITVQIFSFTHGIYIMTKGKTDGNGQKAKIDPKRIVLNPGVVGFLIGLPLFLLPVQMPVVVSQPIDYLASLNTPLAMLIFGTYLSRADLKSVFTDKRLPLVAVLKLLVLPGIMIALYKCFGFTGSLLTSLVITASAPSANNTVMFAAKYGRDTALASQVVSAVSLMSIVTIPLMIGISSAV